MRALLLLFDRTAVLFLGVAAGAAIGYAFGVREQAETPAAVASLDEAVDVQADLGLAGNETTGGQAPAMTPGGLPIPPTQAETRAIQPGIVNAIAAGRPVRVGVFGDSFGDGIWSALYNQLSRKAGYQVVKYSQQATGFTRYKTLNLEVHDRARLATAPVDVAVISFGANDMMGVADGGHVYALLTPKWKDAIARRVSSYVAMLRGQGAIVYWVGLPKMREASYDADVVRMNAFYRGLMGQLDVPFIETAPYSVDAEGRYAAYLPEPTTGKPQLMRANDGIHMSMNGYLRITRGLAGRIKTYVDRARGEAGDGAPPPPVVAPPPIEALPLPKPARSSQPRLDDPLAAEPEALPATPTAAKPAKPDAAAPKPAKPEPQLPPAKGAPADLLPPDLAREGD